MNAAIERNVYLESELDEKEALKSAVQRLKDETKDLRSELKILAPDNDKAALKDSNKKVEECPSSVSSPSTPDSTSSTAQSPLAPSARISALNIVGDLLRKVGALELKLVSCRNMVKEEGKNGATTLSATNHKSAPIGLNRMPRVSSTPTVKDSS
eukprot:TRINITY_DN7285_c0_g1_i2.p1 TRINITY_DN7285_c0_g1~~TRINITY_DN7285_c0_g1_i2.p1  ORF type:complete len:155 (-),score=78.37 TRINITY_DN7285_c0_g1_i2:261-725(-)